MSPFRPPHRRLRAADGGGHLADALDAALGRLGALARTAAFWTGVVLPFLHVPLLFLVGLTETTTPALVGLWTLNAAALTVGARHDPGSGATASPAN